MGRLYVVYRMYKHKKTLKRELRNYIEIFNNVIA